MVCWVIKMFLKVLKPFGKIGIMIMLIEYLEKMMNGENGGEEPTDGAAPTE